MVSSAAKSQKLNVFISYSRRDLQKADQLVAALESNGFEVTIDRRDLPYGEEWQEELADFIRKSDTVIWLISPDSIASKWCNWELGEVSRLNKRLVPLAIKAVSPENLPEALGKIHILPAQGDFSFDEHLQTLVDVLNTNRTWIKEHSRLADRARDWIAHKRSSALLLRGGALAHAEDWKNKTPASESTSTNVLDLILVSRQQATLRQRYWIAGSLTVTLLALVLAGYAFLKSREADIRSAETQLQASRVLAASGMPFKALDLVLKSAVGLQGWGQATDKAEAFVYDLIWQTHFPLASIDLKRIPPLATNPDGTLKQQRTIGTHKKSGKLAYCTQEQSENVACYELDRQFSTSPVPEDFEPFAEFYAAEPAEIIAGSGQFRIKLPDQVLVYPTPEKAEFARAYACFNGKVILQYSVNSENETDTDVQDSKTILFDAASGRKVNLAKSPEIGQGGPKCHKSGKFIALTSTFYSIGIYESDTGRLVSEELLSLPTMRYGFLDLNGIVSISPEHDIFMVSGANVTTDPGAAGLELVMQPQIYSLSSGSTIATLKGHEAPIAFGAFTDNGDRIVTETKTGILRIWKRDEIVPAAPQQDDGASGTSSMATCTVDANVTMTRQSLGTLLCSSEQHGDLAIYGYDRKRQRVFLHGGKDYNDRRLFIATKAGLTDFAPQPLQSNDSIEKIWSMGRMDRVLVEYQSGRVWVTSKDNALEILPPKGKINTISQLKPDDGFLVLANGEFYDLSFANGADVRPQWSSTSIYSAKGINHFRQPLASELAVEDGNGAETGNHGRLHLIKNVLTYCEPALLGWGQPGENCAFFDPETLESISDQACLHSVFSANAALCLTHTKTAIGIYDFDKRKMFPVSWPNFIDSEFSNVGGNLNLELIKFKTCSRRVAIAYSEYIRGGGGIKSPGHLIYDLNTHQAFMLTANALQEEWQMFCDTEELLSHATKLLERATIK